MAEANYNFCTFPEPTWNDPLKMPSPVRSGEEEKREKMKQAILKTTEPRMKSNQTLVIKMLIFTGNFCLCACMCLNLYAGAVAARTPPQRQLLW